MHRLTLLLALQACFVTDAELEDALDRDRDGFQPDIAGGPDCGPEDPAIHPDAVEVCGDGIDNNCDGIVDDRGAGEREWFLDDDGDGWGDGSPVMACNAPDNHVLQAGDCDDDNAEVSPGVLDLCDGQDQDCDGLVDDDATFRLTFRDADGDGFGTPDDTLETCGANPGYVAESGDCDDTDPSIGPTQLDGCDGVDTNCNGSIDDDADFALHYPDDDGDGFGRTDEPLFACGAPSGYATEPGDCVDTDPGIAPGETDSCDEADNDCDGLVDEDATATLYFEDADGDGVGRSDVSISTCQPSPFGYVTVAGDCDDTDPAVIVPSWYLDADGDGHGTGSPVQACTAPADHVALGDDCDDSTDLRAPSLQEICNNGLDDDCSTFTNCRVVASTVFDSPVRTWTSTIRAMVVLPPDFLGTQQPGIAIRINDDLQLFDWPGLLAGDLPLFTIPAPASGFYNDVQVVRDVDSDAVPDLMVTRLESGPSTTVEHVDVFASGSWSSGVPYFSLEDLPYNNTGTTAPRTTICDLDGWDVGVWFGTPGTTTDPTSGLGFMPTAPGVFQAADSTFFAGPPSNRLGVGLSCVGEEGLAVMDAADGSLPIYTASELSGSAGADLPIVPVLGPVANLYPFTTSEGSPREAIGVVTFDLDTLFADTFIVTSVDAPQTTSFTATDLLAPVFPMADFDRDGLLDGLALTDPYSVELTYGRTDGGPSPGPTLLFTVDGTFDHDLLMSALATADMDLDGYADLLTIVRDEAGTYALHVVYGTGQ